MNRDDDRSSTRTLPLSRKRRAAGARGGTEPPGEDSFHGKPEPPGVDSWVGPRCSPEPFGLSPPWEDSFHGRPEPPPPKAPSLGRAPPGDRPTRGDPPGGMSRDILGRSPRLVDGRAPPGGRLARRRGPPGSFPAPHTSLSAGRRRGPFLATQPEASRHDAGRKLKPKSRKITPWL